MSVHPRTTELAAAMPAYGTYAPHGLASLVLSLSRATPLGRGKARRIMYALFRRLHSGIVDTTLFAAPFRLDPRANPLEFRALFAPSKVDSADRAAMRHWLGRPGAIFVDVGANMGLYTFDALLNTQAGQVIAIDPQPAVAKRLAFNIYNLASDNRIALNRVQFFPVAVGEETGTLHLKTDTEEHMVRVDETGEAVEARTLLSIINEAGITKIDCLKIDIEGYEGPALGPFFEKASQTLLPRCIIIEHLGDELWGERLYPHLETHYKQTQELGSNAIWVRKDQIQLKDTV